MKRLSALALCALLAGCGSGGEGRDSVSEWQVDTAAVLSIGQLEGDSVYQLYRVRGIAELPGGDVALANSGSSEVRIYDAQGRFARALGRAGEGPGEFTSVRDLVVRGDTLLAYDRGAGRLTRFLAAGAYLDDRVLRPQATMMIPNFAGLLDDGTAVGWVDRFAAQSVDGFQRNSALLVRFRADEAIDTLGSFAGTEATIERRDLGGGVMSASMSSWDFYRTFRAVAAGDRIYAGSTDSAVVHAWDGSGRALADLRWEEVPQPLDDELLAAYIEREISGLEPAQQEAERKAARGIAHPPTAPVFDRLVPGPSGELWVRRFGAPDAGLGEWLVFDGAGELRARVAMPREREIRAVSAERVYTLERDEYDVEYVRAYPLRR